MGREDLETTISDEGVISLLQQKLASLKNDLAQELKPEEMTGADEEDEAERKEEGNENSATIDLLKKDIENTRRKIVWIEKNGDECASSDCSNKVETGRRKLGGVTCHKDMDREEEILAILETTQ